LKFHNHPEYCVYVLNYAALTFSFLSVGINGKFDQISWMKIEPVLFSKKIDIKLCFTLRKLHP